jgi:hypothetical protein
VNGAAAIAQAGSALDADGGSTEGGHAMKDADSGARVGRVIEKKRPGGRHRFRVTPTGKGG